MSGARRPFLAPCPLAFAMAVVAAVLGPGFTGCKAPGGPSREKDWDWRPKPDSGVNSGADARALTATCEPAIGSHSLPARSTAMSTTVSAAGQRTVFTDDLFSLFRSNCGGCHVEAALGKFNVTAKTFTQLAGDNVLSAIKSDDPARFMPPLGAGGKPFSARASGDPVVELAMLFEHWLMQGRPDALFTVPSDRIEGATSFLLSPDVGGAMTNIGNCVPGALMFGVGGDPVFDRDDMFAAATELPGSLTETDLFTMDAAPLARNRVVAFAPAYPLWSDDAGKIRHIRVPKGQSVKFDKQTQKFTIPPNTRFYKTFLKKVIDLDGNQAYRKMETRLIVARPDRKLDDGTFRTTALFGTYVWNSDETEAVLSRLPLRDGTPFTDSLITYTVDEPNEKAIRDAMPANLKYELEDKHPTLMRHYAIPGSQRCIQCHMGADGGDFVLGFIPLQIARRPEGVGGVYEPTGSDEMMQLQRLIDYGVITGISSEADILPLEKSQGSRKPRNDHELLAQGYMLGNCAHCHNARGFPSVKSAELKDLLDFMPSETGGIFQFPLERTSPLRKRGLDQNVPIPYITPSLREYPVAADGTIGVWVPKWVANCVGDDPITKFICKGGPSPAPAHVPAPWRSLLYRNVDTPFMYADDFVVFPRMPMHTAGFDCRLPRIMGDWMVSIPAIRKDTSVGEDTVPGVTEKPGFGTLVHRVDSNPQPYVEVKPQDAGFAAAEAAAALRLKEFQQGGRYNFCPDQLDIVDRNVLRAGGDFPIVPPSEGIYDPIDPTKALQPDLGVPVRAHWVVTDLSDPPGDWYPRRPDWRTALVAKVVDATELPPATREQELRSRTDVLDVLKDVKITPAIRDFALTEIPFGLWEKKADCAFPSVPKASSFSDAARPRWMTTKVPTADAPVYMQSPGAAIFNNICVNCHGPEADAKGLLADAIMNMSGGTARVADFRHGLFGGPTPGGNRMRVFDPSMATVGLSPAVLAGLSPDATSGLSADDWGGRYMAWMALGGTKSRIPLALLNIVATTRVLGAQRSGKRIALTGSPNMLRLAQELCTHVLPANRSADQFLGTTFFQTGSIDWTDATGLIDTNADAEMWQRLCSLDNRQIVRVPYVALWDETIGKPLRIDPPYSLYFADAYPAGAPVLDHRGLIATGVQPGNLFPLCIRKPASAAEQAFSDKFLAENPVGPAKTRIPYCPAELFAPDPTIWQLKSTYNEQNSQFTYTDANKWATRGAANAGLAVFLYLDRLAHGQVKPKPAFNHCELLK